MPFCSFSTVAGSVTQEGYLQRGSLLLNTLAESVDFDSLRHLPNSIASLRMASTQLPGIIRAAQVAIGLLI